MKTLVRIAVALEHIAEELHQFNLPSKSMKEKADTISNLVIKEKKELSKSERLYNNAIHSRWSKEELYALRDGIKQGIPYDEIAQNIGRTIGACRYKSYEMGWSFRTTKRQAI